MPSARPRRTGKYRQKRSSKLIDEPLTPTELAALKSQHVGSVQLNDANQNYSGPGCPRCADERWPCRVSRLIRMLERRTPDRELIEQGLTDPVRTPALGVCVVTREREYVYAKTTSVFGAFASAEEAWAFVDRRGFGDEARVSLCKDEQVRELRRPVTTGEACTCKHAGTGLPPGTYSECDPACDKCAEDYADFLSRPEP